MKRARKFPTHERNAPPRKAWRGYLVERGAAPAAAARNTSSSSSSTRNTPSPADSENHRVRKLGHKCVVSIRLDEGTLLRIDSLVGEFGGWNQQRSRVIALALTQFLDKHAPKKSGGR